MRGNFLTNLELESRLKMQESMESDIHPVESKKGINQSEYFNTMMSSNEQDRTKPAVSEHNPLYQRLSNLFTFSLVRLRSSLFFLGHHTFVPLWAFLVSLVITATIIVFTFNGVLRINKISQINEYLVQYTSF